MRTDALVNGVFMGLGLGFILATLALYYPVRDFLPQYFAMYHFRFVGPTGIIVLAVGIALEIFQRHKIRNSQERE